MSDGGALRCRFGVDARARHGHCIIDREDLIKPSRHSTIQFFRRFFTAAKCLVTRALLDTDTAESTTKTLIHLVFLSLYNSLIQFSHRSIHSTTH
eukprot:203592-Prorocentrum_minimum.AAC.4